MDGAGYANDEAFQLNDDDKYDDPDDVHSLCDDGYLK